MRNRGNFALKFPNNKIIRFRTREAYSNAREVLTKERFTNVAQMYTRIKSCATGFEFIENEKKSREIRDRFNGIEFEE